MKLFDRMKTRRQRKSQEAYQRERARQKALNEQDVQDAIRDAATGQAGTQQGMVGQS